MTITSPAAPPAPADRVKQLLVQGKTAQQVADLTGWPRQRVVALVNAVHGWLLDPKTDTVYQPGSPKMAPQLPEGVAPAPVEPERKPATVRKGTVDELLAHAAGLDDKTVQRNLGKVTQALGDLREAVRTVNQRREAEEARQEKIRVTLGAIEVLERQLAEARAEAKQLGLKRKDIPRAAPPAVSAPASAASSGALSPKEIRVWAAGNGVECPQYGRIPADVREAYDAAHRGQE